MELIVWHPFSLEFRVVVLLDFAANQGQRSQFTLLFNPSWGEKIWIYTFFRSIYAKVNVTNSCEIRTRLADLPFRAANNCTIRTWFRYKSKKTKNKFSSLVRIYQTTIPVNVCHLSKAGAVFLIHLLTCRSYRNYMIHLQWKSSS